MKDSFYDVTLNILVMLGAIKFMDIVFWCLDHITVNVK